MANSSFTPTCRQTGKRIGLCACCGVGQVFLRGSVALGQDLLFCASCAWVFTIQANGIDFIQFFGCIPNVSYGSCYYTRPQM